MALLNSTTVSTITTLFTTTILTSRRLPALLSLNTARLTSSFAVLRSWLQRLDVAFIPPSAGIYVLAKLGQDGMTEEEEDNMVGILKAAGVLVAGGKSFKMGGLATGWARITFSVPVEVLVEGLRRMEMALFGEAKSSKLNVEKKVNGGIKRKASGVPVEMPEFCKRKVIT
jgi:DNA-binding transcriptional MocR family regulator